MAREPVLIRELVCKSVSLTLLALLHTTAVAQEPQDALPSVDEALRVFVDCRSGYCDFDHIRREIDFVNYVRDRRDADVHVLVTTRATGGGGLEFTFVFIGQQDFESVTDTLYYFSRNTDTQDEIRSGVTQTLRLGLVRYVARTPVGQDLQIIYEAPEVEERPVQEPHDPWDYWIFNVETDGSISGEERAGGFSGSLSLGANRTTEEWKFRISVGGSYYEDRFELSDGSELTSIARGYSGGTFVAMSLGEHWSLGGQFNAGSSTYSNRDLTLSGGPALEYNIFPYSESTRRELTFAYFVLLNYYRYHEITLFDKLEETRPSQRLRISYTVKQPFGTINLSAAGSHFLDNLEQHNVSISSWVNIRLVRGLDLRVYGSFARVKDQIYLPRAGATDDEVLLRRRELGTDFRFWASIGLSYTFGSIYNNVVNPRF